MSRKAFLAFFCFYLLVPCAVALMMEITQKYYKDGSVRMEAVLSGASESYGLQDICDEFYSQTLWKTPSCLVEGEKATMRGILSFKNNKSYAVKRSVPYNTYTLDAKAAYDALPDFGGIDAVLVIEMPGEIIRADAGMLRDNKVELAPQDLSGKERAYIESRELNVSWIIGLASFIPIMLFVSYVAGRQQKRKDYD